MINKKILRLNYAAVTLPSIWSNCEYYSVVYTKNLSEVKGYIDVGWQQLKTILPTEYNLEWNVGKKTYFRLQIFLEDQTLKSRFVGFDEINKLNQRTLRTSYSRHIVKLYTGDGVLQLQMLITPTHNLSTNTVTKLRHDITSAINKLEYDCMQNFFIDYLKGLDSRLSKTILGQNETYKSVKFIKIVKCKIV